MQVELPASASGEPNPSSCIVFLVWISLDQCVIAVELPPLDNERDMLDKMQHPTTA